MKSIVSVFRIIVGVLFIFSGLVKAIDPLGLAYKMQEFFEIWAQDGLLPGLMHALNEWALPFSIIMISFEIVAGVAVLLGWRMNLVSWLLLLLIIFFTFLTGYAYLSGKFRSCGCFGDCIPLSPLSSFIKDLVLTAFILVIFAYRKKIKPYFSSTASVLIIVMASIATAWMQWHVLKHLPFVDCLPFKKGNSIPEKMKIPAGAVPDSSVITFVYDKAGQTVEFTSDNFPDDFDEDVYKFVKRYDKLIRKGNAEPAIKDFVLTSLSGTDTTQEVLNNGVLTGMLFIKDNPGADNWMEDFKELYQALQSKNIPVVAVTNNAEGLLPLFGNMQGIQVLKCDVVPIKTAARANPAFYLLNNGTIIDKWSYADFDDAEDFISSQKGN